MYSLLYIIKELNIITYMHLAFGYVIKHFLNVYRTNLATYDNFMITAEQLSVVCWRLMRASVFTDTGQRDSVPFLIANKVRFRFLK